MAADIPALIRALDVDDPREQRRAGEQLAAAGPRATGALIEALHSASPRARKSVAFLLGRSPASPEVVDALGRAVLEDTEPKVRKNAAMSLGAIGAPEGVAALSQALQREEVGWVRPSIVLALGAIGGEAGHAALGALTPAGSQEAEALRKALDRSAPPHPAVEWNREADWQRVLLAEAPVGLEGVALAEAAERGVGSLERLKAGFLRCPQGLPPWELLPAMRCIYGVLIDGGQGPPLKLEQPEEGAAAIRALLETNLPGLGLHEMLAGHGGAISYRFSLRGSRINRETLRTILPAVREACRPLGLHDSPSRYDVELIVEGDASGSALFVKPSFVRDHRFAYRQKDVGASINPVVAACLARLVRSSGRATIFDPTCGSGTLLIERALLDDETRLHGIDISRTAIAAAGANIKAAGLERRIRVERADATDASAWPAADEVLANLPFGLRTRHADMDTEELYRAILQQLAVKLRPEGRALLYTAARTVFERSLARNREPFQVGQRRRVLSGGVWANLWLLTPRH